MLCLTLALIGLLAGSSTAQTAACKSENLAADIILILDASHWVTESDFKKIVHFVTSFVDSFTYGQESIYLGIFAYRGARNRMTFFSRLSPKEALFRTINKLDYGGGPARFDLGLEFAYVMFSNKYTNRPTAPDFLIAITGGKSSIPEKTKARLALFANKGITFYAIGVGDSADDAELETIASSPSRVLHAEDAQALSTIKDELVADIRRDWCVAKSKV